VKHLVPILLSALVLVSSQAEAAQENVARRHIQRSLTLASAGDTLQAFAELEAAIKAAPKLADTHYYLGRLYTDRASSVETDFKDRLKAEESLLEALRLSPSDPRYLLELARLRLKQHMKVDAGRLFGRALSEAEKRGDPNVLADIHFNLGYLKELEFQSVRHRRLPPIMRGPPRAEITAPVDPRIARYGNEYIGESATVSDAGQMPKEEMFEHYRAALRYNPTHIGASVRLMGQLLDEYRLGEYLSLARQLRLANPERPEPHLYYGLGMHYAGREDEAAEAFGDGLARLPDESRTGIESVAEVMRRRDAQEYLAMDAEERDEFNDRYWLFSDPLYLTEANERRLEHVARAAYADLRFAAPESGLRGWQTDQGVIFMRYGPPLSIASFAAATTDYGNPYAVGRRSIIWSYGTSGPVFIFRQMPGYLGAQFAGDYKFIANEYRYHQPAKYDNIPSIPEMLELPVQIARFRGATEDEIAVEVHAALPLSDLAENLDMAKGDFETGLFILNSAGDKIVSQVESQVLTYAESEETNEYRSWRLVLPSSGMLIAAVEARDQVTWRAAASRETFTPSRYPADSLALSDILVADAIWPRIEEPASRADYEIMPNAALEFRSGEPIHIYYEVYGLNEDAEDFASYDVSIQVRVKSLEHGGGIGALIGAIADSWGFTILGDDRIELRFSREVKMEGRDRVTEYLSLDPQDVPAGEYEIRLRVWDRLGEQMARQLRVFEVSGKE
jgi:GWxTD domain-containing protein